MMRGGDEMKLTDASLSHVGGGDLGERRGW